jgi:large subunit ribosomal protein L20
MPRSKGGVVARRSHKKIIARAKGYFSRRKNIFRVAVQAVEKAEQYQYRDRRAKKRNFRALWIQRRHPRTRPDLRPIYQRPQQGRGCSGPQGSLRSSNS